MEDKYVLFKAGFTSFLLCKFLVNNIALVHCLEQPNIEREKIISQFQPIWKFSDKSITIYELFQNKVGTCQPFE